MTDEEFIGRGDVTVAFAGRGDARLIVLTGICGIGKTRVAAQLLTLLPSKTTTARLDWDYHPPGAASPVEFAERLGQAIDDQCGGLTAFRHARHTRIAALAVLARYREWPSWRQAEPWEQASQRRQAADDAVRGVGDLARATLPAGALADAAGDFAEAGTRLAAAAQNRLAGWLRSRDLVDDDVYAALTAPAGYLASALASDLRRLSAKRPVAIWLDGCEHVREHLEYLTAEVIAPLRRHRVLWLISGQWLGREGPADPVPRWARPVADTTLALELQPFTDAELTEFVAATRPDIGRNADFVRRLRTETFGIPLLAAMALRPGEGPVQTLLHDYTGHLLGRLPDDDVTYLSVLAMTGRGEGHPAVVTISAALGLPADPEREQRVPMLRAGRLHELTARYLRDRLLLDDAYTAIRARVALRYLEWAREHWHAVTREHPDFASRLGADPILEAAAAYCAASFWWTPGDGCRETVRLWAESLASGDGRSAARLLAVAAPFAAALPAQLPERRLLDHLNDASKVSRARVLARSLGYPERVLFALDLCDPAATDTPALLRRHAALPADARDGLRVALGMLLRRSVNNENERGRAMTEQPAAVRARFRSGARVPTAGLVPGYTQVNLVALPREVAFDFMLFAQRNPKPVPLLDVTDPGATGTVLAPGADLRTDLPAYRIWSGGVVVSSPDSVTSVWRDDLVTFLIGCSFTFENALLAAGVPVRHVEQGTNVPMFRTSVECRPAGVFSGPMVVSMRPVPAAKVATAVRVTARYPAVHGAPVHVGAPEELGIRDLSAPDYGDPVEFAAGDVPVFWACGVTPQAALESARLPFAITHEPGHMLITDIPHETYSQ
jgi:uncharacterized protein YcsI (UPF0317 family)